MLYRVYVLTSIPVRYRGKSSKREDNNIIDTRIRKSDAKLNTQQSTVTTTSKVIISTDEGKYLVNIFLCQMLRYLYGSFS
jgi:hypothetical protein